MDQRYDVVILGGAFSGASAAILLRREQPGLRVLIVEKALQFDEKVGEATTEMSAMFLTRRLGMWHHLETEQLPKEGLRYWFSNDKVHSHAEATEVGGFLRSAVPAFQLRRDVLDEHLLATAVAEGAELLRPARVVDVEIRDFDNTVILESQTRTGDDTGGARQVQKISCRWVLDATGKVTFLGRKLGLIDRNDAHPTAALWCRWKNVRHIDDLAARGPLSLSRANVGSRRLSTNHYMGFGYWIWYIPLGNGETSIGIVFDKRLVRLHESRQRPADYVAFLKAIPAAAELLEGATMREEDFRFYAHLPYVTRQYMGKGWALLGDAAAFLDPYYSPGLDHAAFSVEATNEILKMDFTGKPVDLAIDEHNVIFVRSYHRFFKAAYLDKYYYMGEADLLSASFLLDTAQYYIFVVTPAYRFLGRFHWMPVFGPKPAIISYRLMSLYNRRLKKIALARREHGVDGLRNNGRRIKAYYNLNFAPFHMAARGVKLWMLAELDLLWLRVRSMVRSKKKSVQPEAPTAPAAARDAGPEPLSVDR